MRIVNGFIFPVISLAAILGTIPLSARGNEEHCNLLTKDASFVAYKKAELFSSMELKQSFEAANLLLRALPAGEVESLKSNPIALQNLVWRTLKEHGNRIAQIECAAGDHPVVQWPQMLCVHDGEERNFVSSLALMQGQDEQTALQVRYESSEKSISLNLPVELFVEASVSERDLTVQDIRNLDLTMTAGPLWYESHADGAEVLNSINKLDCEFGAGQHSDGTVRVGTDPLYTGSTEVRIEGFAAYVFYKGLLRNAIRQGRTPSPSETLTGKSLSCRVLSDVTTTDFNKKYACTAKFNFEKDGELLPSDPERP